MPCQHCSHSAALGIVAKRKRLLQQVHDARLFSQSSMEPLVSPAIAAPTAMHSATAASILLMARCLESHLLSQRSVSVIPRELARLDAEQAIDHYLAEAGRDVAFGFIDALEATYAQIGANPSGSTPRWGQELNLPGLRSQKLKRYGDVAVAIVSEALLHQVDTALVRCPAHPLGEAVKDQAILLFEAPLGAGIKVFDEKAAVIFVAIAATCIGQPGTKQEFMIGAFARTCSRYVLHYILP